MADVGSLTVTYIVLTLVLVVVNVAVVYPAAVSLEQIQTENNPNANFDGVDSVSGSRNVSFATGCIPGTGDNGLFDQIIGSILGVAGFFLELFTDTIFKGEDDLTCVRSFNLLSGVVVLSVVMIALGGLVLVGGFLTSGASQGGVAMVGWAIIIVGSLTTAFGLISPTFALIPAVGDLLFALYAGIGYILVLYTGLGFLSGGGT